MITRVYGTINSKEVEFHPIEDRPGYWEGFGPKGLIYQNIEIWAENDRGKKGHLRCTLVIRDYSPTQVRLILFPYAVSLFQNYRTSLLSRR